MLPVLQITLSLAVVVLTVFLVMFLLQVRRTAAAVERLAESATRDLHQVSEDLHEVRLRTEEVANLARNALEHPSMLTQVVTGVVRAIPACFGPRPDSSNFLDTLLTGLRTAVHLFRRPKATPPEEEPHE